jgi:peptidoglycan hydrolase FlgJ
MKVNSLQSAPIPLPTAATAPTGAKGSAAAPLSKEAKVAQEFESIFLRKMLAGLQKTTSMSGHAPGADMYGQMITDAFADSMTQAGGIGLAQSIEANLTGKKP